jgi:pimeloyl-ACP methyl ester carboxylesterase
MYAADPDRTIAGLDVPVLAIVGDAPDGPRSRALAVVSAARVAAGRPPVAALALGPIGHNVMRYRPAEVTEAIRSAAR